MHSFGSNGNSRPAVAVMVRMDSRRHRAAAYRPSARVSPATPHRNARSGRRQLPPRLTFGCHGGWKRHVGLCWHKGAGGENPQRGVRLRSGETAPRAWEDGSAAHAGSGARRPPREAAPAHGMGAVAAGRRALLAAGPGRHSSTSAEAPGPRVPETRAGM